MSSQTPASQMRRHEPVARKWLRGRVLLLAMAVGLLALACGATLPGRGSYPLDIFYEMHYQQSYKSNEPPRLSGVAGAVAWFPPPRSTAFATNSGSYLFGVNCSMCPGAGGKGDGPVLTKMTGAPYNYQPVLTPDLTDPAVSSIGVQGIEGYLASGIVVMPSFKKLLSSEERRLIAEYVVNCLQVDQAQRSPDCS